MPQPVPSSTRPQAARALGRVALVLVAVAAIAWFWLGTRQARDTSAGGALAGSLHRLSPAQADRAGRLLAAAGRLNPDSHVDVLRAELALQRRDPRGAERILRTVVRREPQDIEAWAWLLNAAQAARDPATGRFAQARVQALAPPVPAR